MFFRNVGAVLARICDFVCAYLLLPMSMDSMAKNIAAVTPPSGLDTFSRNNGRNVFERLI